MIITSCGGLLLVVVGLVSLKKKHHHSSLVTALLAGLLVCVAVAAVVLVFLLRANIEHDINKVNVEAELRTAVADEARMELWDSLQARLELQLVILFQTLSCGDDRYSCCGGLGNSGYHDWESVLNGSYPDSCCTVRYPGCGRHAHR